jgi:hypothetical protein
MPEAPNIRNRTPTLLLLAALLLTILVYYPGLGGDFIFDDTWNISTNRDIHIDELSLSSLNSAATSGQSGPLGRPLSMASFAVNYYFSALTPSAYKATNLAIHLASGCAIYLFVFLLLGAHAHIRENGLSRNGIRLAAALVATLWLLHPLNLTSVLYVVQRMTSLASLFMVLAFIAYVFGRSRQIKGDKGALAILSSVLVFTPIAVLCKETALLVPIYLLVIEWSIFRFKTTDKAAKTFLQVFFVAIIILPGLAIAAYLLANPGIIQGSYLTRDFTLTERLYTEARVLWTYIRLIVLPSNATLGLFHDDIFLSTGLLSPVTTLLSIIGLIFLVAGAIAARKSLPLVSFGILFFLSGHLLESGILGLEIAHEHRNYLPQLGLLIPAACYLTSWIVSSERRKLAITVAAAAPLLLGLTTLVRSSTWGDTIAFSSAEITHHPNSARANYQMGRIYATAAGTTPTTADYRKYAPLAEQHFIKAGQLQDNYTDGLFGLLVLHSSNGSAAPAQLIDQIADKLAGSNPSANTINQLNNLVRCTLDNFCQITASDMDRIFSSILNNPNLKGRSRHIASNAIERFHDSHPPD